jgi:hypothetical protein
VSVPSLLLSPTFKMMDSNFIAQSLPCAIISCLGMTFFGTIFLFPTTVDTTVADMNYTVVVLAGVIILALVWYYFPVYGGVHWFTGPVANVEGFETHNWGGGQPETPSETDENMEKEKADATVDVKEA